ncbi:RidA family protein [Lactococcus garvieae]|uniref:RidA family protein n=1 Tax=Lactococcus garvieae TaxID=1363 RepID=UPI003D76DD4F
MLKRITSKKLPKAVGSYSAATEVGEFIFTSGQLPINGETNIIEFPDNIEKQSKQAMDNVKSILEDNGSSLENIIKTTVYLANIEDFSSFNKVYGSYFEGEYPARTAFEVGKLPMGALIEIEVIAKKEEN